MKSGYNSYEDYQRVRTAKNDEKVTKMKQEYESSYFYKKGRADLKDYNIFYNPEDRESQLYNPEVFSELIKREASKIGNIEEVHSSAKSGSKFGNSVYLVNKDTGVEVRISNHYLPDTAERNYNREKFGGTRWDKEVVLDQYTMNELVEIKTEEEMKKYIRDLFK